MVSNYSYDDTCNIIKTDLKTLFLGAFEERRKIENVRVAQSLDYYRSQTHYTL